MSSTRRALSGRKHRSVTLLILLTGLMLLGSCATVRLTFLGVLNKDFTPMARTSGQTPVATGSIAGKVVASDGTTPISGGEISARQSEPLYFGSATTSADGTYRIDDLPRGTYEIRATAPGFVVGIRKDVLVAKGQTVTAIGFSLPKAGSIAGKVTEADGMTPIGAIEVAAFDTSTKGLGSAVTSGDGTYLIVNLPPGNYTVQTVPPGFLAASRTGVSVATGHVTPNTNFSLPKTGSISGTVTERDGITPIHKAEILAFGPNGGAGFAASETNGTYRVSGLAQGKYEIRVAASGFMETSKTGVIVTPGKETGDVDFPLSKGASISGRVVTVEGMVPKKGASVLAIKGEEVAGYALTQEDGSYTLDGLSAGTYDVELQGEDVVVKGIKLSDGQMTTGIDFTPPATASISGKVVEETGSLPVEGATVLVSEYVSGESLPRLVNAAGTDSGGGYTIRGLETGAYVVEVKKLGYEAQKKDHLTVAANQGVTDLGFSIGKMARVGSISGTVKASMTLMPLAGTEIRITDEEGDYVPIGSDNLTSKSGTYAINGLRPGSYSICARTVGYADEWYPNARVAPDSTTPVGFLMTRGGSISGTVTTAENQPVGDAMVFFKEDSLGVGAPLLGDTRTDNKGKFLIEHIKAGVYTVVLFKEDHSPGTVTGVRVTGGRLTPNANYRLESK